MTDLRELDSVDIRRVIWETLKEFALTQVALDPGHRFHIELEGGLYSKAFNKCQEAGLILAHIKRAQYAPFKHVVLKVYYNAVQLGLVIPRTASEDLNWPGQTDSFQFTAEGIEYFSRDFISLDDPSNLELLLRELESRFNSVTTSQTELLLEAQRCMKAGCYRAGIIVIGVANEDFCLELVNSIPQNCNPPSAGSQLHQDWLSCLNTPLAFAAKWKPAIRLLEALKNTLRPKGRGENWWQWWEMIPGSLHTLGEAVRIARNSAAHSPERSFNRAELALLLAGKPIHLEMIASITNLLQNPPAGITLQF